MPLIPVRRALAISACLSARPPRPSWRFPAWGATEEPAGEFSAQPLGEPTALSAPDLPGLKSARALIDAGRFEDALAILNPLAQEHLDHPRRTDILFLSGLAATQASQGPDVSEERRTLLLNLGIASFRFILFDRPELVRVRLELARAFFLKGEDSLSQRHFEWVLAGEPPEPLVANIRSFPERDPRQAALELQPGRGHRARHQYRRHLG